MPIRLRTGMYCKMFAAGCSLQIFAASLQAFDKTYSEPGSQVRIFSIGFMSASPARITENIDIRRPDRKTFVDIAVAVLCKFVMLCALLGRNNLRRTLYRILIEHGRKRNCLREHGRHAGACRTVQTLVPPVIRRNTEPLNRGCIVDQLCSLFRRCQAVYEILSALLRGQRYITEFFQLITPVSSGASP